jgi:hypothetical protein
MAFGLICLAIGGPAQGAGDAFDGVYTGKRVLTKGPSPPCPDEEDVSVTIKGETLSFTNSALRAFVLHFEPHPDGSFGQIYVGGAAVLIQGRISGDTLDADVVNSSNTCEHHWHLLKEH